MFKNMENINNPIEEPKYSLEFYRALTPDDLTPEEKWRTDMIKDSLIKIQGETHIIENKIAEAIKNKDKEAEKLAKQIKAEAMKDGSYNMGVAAQDIENLDVHQLWGQWFIYEGTKGAPLRIAEYASLSKAEKINEMREKLKEGKALLEGKELSTTLTEKNELFSKEAHLMRDYKLKKPKGDDTKILVAELKKIEDELTEVLTTLDKKFDPQTVYLANAHLQGRDIDELTDGDLWMAWMIYHTRDLGVMSGHLFIYDEKDFTYVEDERDPRFVKHAEKVRDRINSLNKKREEAVAPETEELNALRDKYFELRKISTEASRVLFNVKEDVEKTEANLATAKESKNEEDIKKIEEELIDKKTITLVAEKDFGHKKKREDAANKEIERVAKKIEKIIGPRMTAQNDASENFLGMLRNELMFKRNKIMLAKKEAERRAEVIDAITSKS